MDLGLLNPLRPISERTLSDEAAERLRSAIRDGTLPAGTRLVERELAQRLGVSRIPVREAIQQLVEDGLVKKTPHSGTFVYAPSSQELEEIASLRVVLERFVVERVMARWRPHHEVQLRQMSRRCCTRRLGNNASECLSWIPSFTARSGKSPTTAC